MDAVVVSNLVKKFNSFAAVNGISFSVKKGELFGLLGPNGAGKSTTIYMLTTLIQPTSGTAVVNGFDIQSQSDKVRESIGIVFQDQTVDTRLSAYDNLDIHGRMYGMDAESRREKIDEVLQLVELTEWKYKEGDILHALKSVASKHLEAHGCWIVHMRRNILPGFFCPA